MTDQSDPTADDGQTPGGTPEPAPQQNPQPPQDQPQPPQDQPQPPQDQPTPQQSPQAPTAIEHFLPQQAPTQAEPLPPLGQQAPTQPGHGGPQGQQFGPQGQQAFAQPGQPMPPQSPQFGQGQPVPPQGQHFGPQGQQVPPGHQVPHGQQFGSQGQQFGSQGQQFAQGQQVPHGQQFGPQGQPFGPQGQQYGQPGQPYVFGAPPPAGGNRRRNWLVGGSIVAVLAVVAVVALVFLTRTGAETGANSADAAALDMLAAVTKRDTTAVVELVAPAEAGSLRQVLDSAQAKAESVEVQKGGGQDGLLEGVTISTENVNTNVEQLRSNLARVTFTGGTLTARFDPDTANQGLKDLFGDDLESGSGTINVSELQTYGRNGDAVDPFVMAVKQGDRWYVSPAYTAMEYVEIDNGGAKADYSARPVEPRAFPTPEAAADGFVSALSEAVEKNNIDPVIAALPGYYGELFATYRTLITDDLDLSDVQQLTFSNGKYSTEELNGLTYVNVDNLEFYAIAEGESVRGVITGDCVKIDGEEEVCGNALDDEASPLLGDIASKNAYVATQDDIGWHIDPVQSAMGSILYTLDNTTDEQLYRMLGLELDVPQMTLKVKGDASLQGTNSVSLRLPDGRRFESKNGIVDLDVQAGQPVTIEVKNADPDSFSSSFRVHTSDGYAQDVDRRTTRGYTTRGAPATFTFTPETTETAKIVIRGDAGSVVEVTRK